MPAKADYTLYYWPGIQGRGEFVRLALEEGGARYIDIALVPEKKGGGVPAMVKLLEGRNVARPPFASPFLKAGADLIGQTAAILLYLGPKLGLVPRDAASRLWIHQLQLTIADFVGEIHDTHHPLGAAFYYEEQKPEARRRAKDFRESRLAKYLGYFERVMERNAREARWMVGAKRTYVDLSMAQVIAGLGYAFPKATARVLRDCPRLVALHERVFALPRIVHYVASGRRIPFNNDGVFRNYPELDG
jgi:glutathione S-transferase